MEKEEETSEFGKGFVYCLGNFLAHEMKMHTLKIEGERMKAGGIEPSFFNMYELWFNGAADHLFDMDIDNVPKSLKGRAKRFQSKCLGWRLVFAKDDKSPTEKDFVWATKEAREMLMAVDNILGIKTVKGDWE